MNITTKLSSHVFIAALLVFASGSSAQPTGISSWVTNSLPPSVPSMQMAATKAPYVEGQVLIKYKSTIKAAARASMVARMGVQEMKHLGTMRLMQVKLPPGQTVAQAVEAYSQDLAVESVQPNYRYKAATAPNDLSYGELWGLKNTRQTITHPTYATNNPGTNGMDINAESAWDVRTDCSSVIVAVIDSGVNYMHQDLAANMWDGSAAGFPKHGYDFAGTPDDDPMPDDADGHGTHVAAIIAAAGNNGVGVTGVCWKAKIMAIRALDMNGGTTADIVAGIDFAIAKGAKVINMSLGNDGAPICIGCPIDPIVIVIGDDVVMSEAITRAHDSGVIVVAAAGNESADNDVTPTYPCSYTQDNLLCVVALDQAYALANFSNFGATSVDLGAPGVNIWSAKPGQRYFNADNFAGWVPGAGWAINSCDLGAGPITMLTNPTTWCSNPAGTYADNAIDSAYVDGLNIDWSVFPTQVLGAGLYVAGFGDVELGGDTVDVAFKIAGGDPFAAPDATASYTGSGFLEFQASLNACNDSVCSNVSRSIGVRLLANGDVVKGNDPDINDGVGFFPVGIDTAESGSTHYRVANGTSMAAPYVAGVAALVWAQNPDYTYNDVIEAIKNGGRAVAALATNTTTGRALDANGAVRYLKAPSGLIATVQ